MPSLPRGAGRTPVVNLGASLIGAFAVVDPVACAYPSGFKPSACATPPSGYVYEEQS